MKLVQPFGTCAVTVSFNHKFYSLCQVNDLKILPQRINSQIYLFSYKALIERFKNVDAIGKEPNENNTYKYITMECKNDPTGGVPYWDPTYDHLIQPFPECVLLRKYSFICHLSLQTFARQIFLFILQVLS